VGLPETHRGIDDESSGLPENRAVVVMSDELDYLPEDPADITLQNIQQAIDEDPFEVPYDDAILTQAVDWRRSDDDAENKRWDRLLNKIRGNGFHMSKERFIEQVDKKESELRDDDGYVGVSEMEPHEQAAYVWEKIEKSDEYYVLAVGDDRTLWAYNPNRGIWENGTGTNLLGDVTIEILGNSVKNKVMRELEGIAKHNNAIDREDLGTPDSHVAINGELVPLKNRKKRRQLKPEDRAIIGIPTEYDPDADAPEFRELANEVIENDKVEAVQKFLGYLLMAEEHPVAKALVLVGDGANGKSTFLRIVRAALGQENVSSQSLKALNDQRFAAAELQGKLANIRNEIGAKSLTSDGNFMSISAGETITVERKHQDPFQLEVTTKLIYATNQLPSVDLDYTEQKAFFRRWVIAEFPNSYAPEEQDEELADRIIENELPGVLNWMLEGYDKLLQDDFEFDDESWAETQKKWNTYGDDVAKFIAYHIKRSVGSDKITPAKRVYNRYLEFAKQQNQGREPEEHQPLVSQRKLSERIANATGFKSTNNTGNKRGWVNLSLVTNPDKLPNFTPDG
jgi:putative DNA primase/helicase